MLKIENLTRKCLQRRELVGSIVVALVLVATLFNHEVKAQRPQTSVPPRVPNWNQVQIINASSIITDASTGLNRVSCYRDPAFYLQGETLRFSIGFPEVEILGRPGRAQGSWTIRNLVSGPPEQVASYLLDGTFDTSGQSILNNGTFTLTGTANYQNACTRGTPPPATPGSKSPHPGTVHITIQGTCGTRNAAGVVRPTDLTFEAADPAGVIVNGSFRATVACTTSNSFSGINNNLAQH